MARVNPDHRTIKHAFAQMGLLTPFNKRLKALKTWLKEEGQCASDDDAGAESIAYAMLGKARCNVIHVCRLSKCQPATAAWLSLVALLFADEANEAALKALVAVANSATGDLLTWSPCYRIADREWRLAANVA